MLDTVDFDVIMLIRGNSAVGIPLYYSTVYDSAVLVKNLASLGNDSKYW